MEPLWLPPGAIGLGRFQPDHVPLAAWLRGLMGERGAACWDHYESTVEAGYMFETEAGTPALYGFRGATDRRTIERCAGEAFAPGELLAARVVRDGDLTRIETDAGTAVLWWRPDGWIVAGNAEQIAAVRASGGDSARNECLERLRRAWTDQPMSLARCDELFEAWLGHRTTGWIAEVRVEPSPLIEVTVFYPSAAGAQAAAKGASLKELPASVPGAVRDLLASVPSSVSVSGDRLRIEISITADHLAAFGAGTAGAAGDLVQSEESDGDSSDRLKRYWEERRKDGGGRAGSPGP